MTFSLKKQKYADWFWVILINFMWATQVPVIRLIGDRLGPVTLAYIPMILSTLLFLPALWWQQKRQGTGLRWHWRDAKHFFAGWTLGRISHAIPLHAGITVDAGL